MVVEKKQNIQVRGEIMLPYLKAEHLKKQFVISGCFYELECDHSLSLPCRNVLEIFDKTRVEEQATSQLPDALFILLNPGKSMPSDPKFSAPKVKIRNLNLIISKETLVPAKPNGPDYQIMRLMKMKQWGYVRVITLSDIRDPDRKNFLNMIQNPQLAKNKVHSIFSDKRINERLSAFQIKPNAPVIAAWGKEDCVRPLAQMCIEKAGCNIKGVCYQDSPLLYYQACPSLTEQKQKWLLNISSHLE